MRHAAWIMVVAMGCGVEAPANISGSYGAQPVEDEDGTKLLAGGDDGDQGEGADDAPPPAEEGQTEQDEDQIGAVFPNGSTVKTTSDLNLRKGPGTDYDVLRAMPEGASVIVTNGVPDNGFIEVTHEGLAGFASYRYLRADDAAPLPDAGAGPVDPGPGAGWRETALAIAANGVGLSYWWGHGKLYDGVPPAGVGGSCDGSCPSCTHAGSYGADCSGFVAKAWVVPSSNSALETDTHPYSTSDFYSTTGSGKWSTVSKASVKGGDAMVYRSGSSGHIFLYEKGDAWGQPWTFEARGCSYGIVHNIRTSGSTYKAIARADAI